MKEQEGWMINIQCDWNECVANDGGHAWILYKQYQKPADHDKLKKTGNDTLAIGDKFKARFLRPRVLEVTHIPTGRRVTCVAPVSSYSDLIPSSKITNVDVSSGGLGVVSSDNEKLSVWETATGTVRRQLEGHLGEVYTAQLFPSGVVVLSGGSDLRIKIWSASTGECPVTLTGHTQPVTDMSVVSRGKNIISVSKDGTVRLWSCGEMKCISVLATIGELCESLNCCDISDQSLFHPLAPGNNDETELNSPEVETEGKVLAVGSETGSVTIINIAARTILHTYNCGSPVNCVAWTRDQLHVGCQDGSLHVMSKDGVEVVKNSTSPVLCLRYVIKLDRVLSGRQDGSVTISCSGGNNVQNVLLTGPDTDPVYSISDDGKNIYTGCRDGVVRKYELSDLMIQ